MHTISFIVAAAMLACAAHAQSGLPNGIPSCAAGCVGTSFGGCSGFNYTCICSNRPYLDQLGCCVNQNCDASDQDATIQLARALCDSQGGGTSALPTAATCASSSGGSTATGQSSSSTSTGSTSPTFNIASTTPSSTSSPTTDSGTESAAATTTTGAAHRAGVEVGLGLAAVGAMFAL